MKGKTQKGITLIALIITIVVLLILAAVAVSSIQNDGILQYAQNSADSWNQAQVNEAATIQNYSDYLEENIGGSTSVTLISFTIEGTAYQAEKGMTWERWIGSDYNTSSYIFGGMEYLTIFISANRPEPYILDSSSNTIAYSDPIIANEVYVVEV